MSFFYIPTSCSKTSISEGIIRLLNNLIIIIFGFMSQQDKIIIVTGHRRKQDAFSKKSTVYPFGPYLHFDPHTVKQVGSWNILVHWMDFFI